MDLSSLGKWIILFGLAIIVVGLVVWLAGKVGLPFGSLPGDIRVERPFLVQLPGGDLHSHQYSTHGASELHYVVLPQVTAALP